MTTGREKKYSWTELIPLIQPKIYSINHKRDKKERKYLTG